MTKTLLVVDDDADILESLCDLFETSIPRVRVLTARSGTEAMEVLREHTVDLVVSDFRMPGMDGLTFLEAVDAPCILITAYPDLELALKAIGETRVEAFLTKPFDPMEVLAVATAVLEGTFDPATKSAAMQRALAGVWRQGGALTG